MGAGRSSGGGGVVNAGRVEVTLGSSGGGSRAAATVGTTVVE